MPRGFDLKVICAAMAEIAGLNGVYDLHLRSVAGDDAEVVRRAMTDMLEAQFAIHHVSLRTEPVPCDDETALHR